MPAPSYLVITTEAWRATAALLAPYADAKTEAGLYWYGIRNSEAAVATVVGIPRQINRRGNFEVARDDLASLVLAVPDELVAVAQVHTHPGADTLHSPWDDDLVVSQKILSLVLPRYGRSPSLDEVGVHECTDGFWQRLPSADVNKRIVVVPPVIDTR